MREASTTGAFAEPGPSRATPEQALSQAQERWRAAFATIETEADRMPELLKQAHASAAPLEPHDDLRRWLAELAAKGENAAGRIRSLVDYIDRLQDEWSAAHRYTRDGVARLTQQLDSRIVEDGRRGGQAWLHALFDAADAGESAAAAAIATA